MVNTSNTDSNIWRTVSFVLIGICFVEFILILYQKRKSLSRHHYKDNLRPKRGDEGEVDFGNVFNSAFLSDKLYHELIKRCHPDLFATDPVKQQIATDLSQRITQNKVNYKVLQDLKEEAETKLNIQFRL